MSNSKAHLRDLAYALYVEGSKTYEQVAAQLKISIKTVAKWSDEGNWRDLRVSMTTTRQAQVKHLLAQLDEINRSIAEKEQGARFPNPEESNTIERLTRSIERLEAEMTLSQRIGVMKEFTTRLFQLVGHGSLDRETYQQLVDLSDDYIQSAAASKA